MQLQFFEPWADCSDPDRFWRELLRCVKPWDVQLAAQVMLRLRRPRGASPYARDFRVWAMRREECGTGTVLTVKRALQAPEISIAFNDAGVVVAPGLRGPERMGYLVGGSLEIFGPRLRLMSMVGRPLPREPLPIERRVLVGAGTG